MSLIRKGGTVAMESQDDAHVEVLYSIRDAALVFIQVRYFRVSNELFLVPRFG